MGKDWIERRYEDFATQAKLFCETIAADAAAYQISPADAALLMDDYTAFAITQTAASLPSERTTIAVIERKAARRRLQDRMRDLGARIRANSTISDQAKAAITLSVPRERSSSRGHGSAPDEAPRVLVRSIVANMITVRLLPTATSGRRGKPRYAIGAELLYHAGEEPPHRVAGEWQRGGLTTSGTGRIVLPQTLTSKRPRGTRIWIAARWFNSHGPGPISELVYTHLADIGVPPAAGPASAGATMPVAMAAA